MLLRKKYQEAFTIVELLIVIVVIAVLATISVVAYNGIMGRAQESSLKSDLSQASKQLAVDKTLTGGFPGSTASADGGNGLKAAGGTNYQYTVNSSTFCLSAVNGTRGYFITESNTPQEGVCPGHTGPGGGGDGTVVACDGYSVGSPGPAGGIIFYKDTASTPAKCYEAAPAGWYGTGSDPSAEWGCFNVIVSGADGSAIGTGRQNTADMVAANCLLYNSGNLLATRIVSNYTGGGKTDWYLPSKDELNEVYKQRSAIGGLSGAYYWSSSEFSDRNAWYYAFLSNTQQNVLKMNQFSVRPVRSFSNN